MAKPGKPKPDPAEIQRINIETIKDTCFVIGNGESRNIFKNLETLKHKGAIYGCNAIYRDWPDLCDKIFAVNPPMYDEVLEAKKANNYSFELIGKDQTSKWNYLLEEDKVKKQKMPKGLQLYRYWIGGNNKTGVMRTLDLSEAKGSGCSAVLHAAEQGYKHIFCVAFDMLGAGQYRKPYTLQSREQNNIYKNTPNYPTRMNMKAYLKYEWMFQLTQIARKFTNSNIYMINRKEYLKGNNLLPHYMKHSKNNFYGAHYAELQKFIDNPRDPRGFFKFSLRPS